MAKKKKQDKKKASKRAGKEATQTEQPPPSESTSPGGSAVDPKPPDKPPEAPPRSRSLEEVLLEKILHRLSELSPRVRKLPVEDVTDGRATMLFLDLDDLCLITTDIDFRDRDDADKEEAPGEDATPPPSPPPPGETRARQFDLMFVSRSGRRYYANGSLARLEDVLADNASWLRASQRYLLNLDAVVRSRIGRARDLMLEGVEGWLSNAVSPNSAGGIQYLDEFQKRFITSV